MVQLWRSLDPSHPFLVLHPLNHCHVPFTDLPSKPTAEILHTFKHPPSIYAVTIYEAIFALIVCHFRFRSATQTKHGSGSTFLDTETYSVKQHTKRILLLLPPSHKAPVPGHSSPGDQLSTLGAVMMSFTIVDATRFSAIGRRCALIQREGMLKRSQRLVWMVESVCNEVRSHR